MKKLLVVLCVLFAIVYTAFGGDIVTQSGTASRRDIETAGIATPYNAVNSPVTNTFAYWEYLEPDKVREGYGLFDRVEPEWFISFDGLKMFRVVYDTWFIYPQGRAPGLVLRVEAKYCLDPYSRGYHAWTGLVGAGWKLSRNRSDGS